ncbi:hypothetical protein Ddye_010542 [Dipteronia dyeriana]|uniref:Uncharacterized protein n=1 Tax=Dipteronia dyeriana TaxID=168575 RepID=A0AAE0CN90_9ROSI|nr:hypothetical protein Ddye_010542 [Dipteronia dyeriana]
MDVKRWKWWRICSDDGEAMPASLKGFLEVERRFRASTRRGSSGGGGGCTATTVTRSRLRWGGFWRWSRDAGSLGLDVFRGGGGGVEGCGDGKIGG